MSLARPGRVNSNAGVRDLRGTLPKVVLASGIVLALGGIVGLAGNCPPDVLTGKDWTYVPFDLGRGLDYAFDVASLWGAWALASFIAALAGGFLSAIGVSLVRPRVAAVGGICCAVIGFLLLCKTWPTLEPIAHHRGHAMSAVLDPAMRLDLGAFYVSEIVFLIGALTALASGTMALIRQMTLRFLQRR